MNRGSETAAGRPPAFRAAVWCGDSRPARCGVEDFSRKLADRLSESGMAVTEVDGGRWTLAWVPAVLRRTRADRPDAIVMHYPTIAFGRGFGPVTVAVAQRIAPMVLVLHEFSRLHLLRRGYILPMLLRAERIVFTNDVEMEQVLALFPAMRRKSRVIPIASTISPDDVEASRDADGPFRVTFFGQPRPDRGVEAFLTLAEMIRARGLPVDASLVGAPTPAEREYFEKIRIRGEAANVRFVLNASDREVVRELASAKLCYLPYPDGASLKRTSLLAALDSATPVLTTISADTPDTLRACVTEARTPEDALAIVVRAVECPGFLAELRERGRASAALPSKWPQVTVAYDALLRGLPDPAR